MVRCARALQYVAVCYGQLRSPTGHAHLAVNFFTDLIGLTTKPRRGRSTNVHHAFGCSEYLNNPLGCLPIPPLVLKGIKKCKFGLDFESLLSRPHFETKQRFGTKVNYLVQLLWTSVLPKFGAVWLTPYEEWILKVHPLKRTGKSSIPQPEIVRFRSNFVQTLYVTRDT